MLNLAAIDHSWTLFLDRDGVINHEKHKDYINRYCLRRWTYGFVLLTLVEQVESADHQGL